MAKVIFGNHASVLVARQERDRIRQLRCDVLGGQVVKADPERDFIRLGPDFFIAFLYGDVPDESATLRNARSIQCLRLVGIDEDMSFYEGAGDGPNVAKVKDAVSKLGHA